MTKILGLGIWFTGVSLFALAIAIDQARAYIERGHCDHCIMMKENYPIAQITLDTDVDAHLWSKALDRVPHIYENKGFEIRASSRDKGLRR